MHRQFPSPCAQGEGAGGEGLTPQKFNTFNTFNTLQPSITNIWHQCGIHPSVTPTEMTKEGVILSPQAKNLGARNERTPETRSLRFRLPQPHCYDRPNSR